MELINRGNAIGKGKEIGVVPSDCELGDGRSFLAFSGSSENHARTQFVHAHWQ